MLERLFGSKTQPSLVASAFDDFSTMLHRAAEMYELALTALFDNTPLEVDLDKMDDDIDEAEARIRRAVLEHLSLAPSRDLVASLVLISMVQDAERIGDFARGLGDIPALGKHPVSGPFADELRAIARRVLPLFGRCEKAFSEDSGGEARAVIAAHLETKPELSRFIARVADSDTTADMAIVYATTARSIQRISAHLSNIASSVVQPFHRIRHDDETDN